MNFRKSKFYVSVLFTALTAFTACKDNNDPEIETVKEQEVIQGNITGTKTLSADKTYLLRGYVRVMANAKLVIPAGTIIKGEKASKAALIVERDGDIEATGTATNPVVFTSDQAAGARNIGDWAGIIIAGNAKVNTTNGTAQYESGVLGAEVALYGGQNDDDNSGILTYVRIEFAGIAIQTDKEINGLTLCGVGRGTTINNIQVSYGGDDSFEFFGGTVNAKNLIAYRGTDDDFDFDQGYSGKLQYGISIKDPNVADGAGTSRGIELENKGTVTGDRYTKPVISNFTFLGPGSGAVAAHGAGVHYGENSRLILANSIVVNHKGNAVEINKEWTANELEEGRSMFMNNVVFGNTANYGLKDVTSFADAAALTLFMGTKNNATVANLAGVGFTSTTITAPNLTLATSSVANGKASFTATELAGLDVVTYSGAMGTVNWTSGWANWDPKNATY